MAMQAAAVAERLNLRDCDIAGWATTSRKNKRRKRTKVITADDGSFSVAVVGEANDEGAGDGAEPEVAASEIQFDDHLMSDDERESSDGDDDYVCCQQWCDDKYNYPLQLVQDLRQYYYSLPQADRQEFIDQRTYLPEGHRARTQRCMEPPAVLRSRLSVLRSPLGGFCGTMPAPANLDGRCNPVHVCTEYFRYYRERSEYIPTFPSHIPVLPAQGS